VLEQALFGDDDPVVVASAHVATALGSPVARVRFTNAGTGWVLGADLVDGRSVVLKVHRWHASVERLAAVARVQGALAARGVPIARPLHGPAPLGTGLATVEELRVGDRASARRPEIRRSVAAALAAVVAAGRGVDVTDLSVSELGRPSGDLWGEPHDLRFDFPGTAAGAEWIDELAEGGYRRMAGHRPLVVVGHLDWRVENLGFDGDDVVAIYDTDSLGLAPEAYVVGCAADQFTTDWAAGEPVPTLDEVLGFVADYEVARGAPFDPDDRVVLEAASICHLAYLARCEHSIGRSQSVGFAALLRARAEMAGLR
jgi:hypothetical protein